MFGNTNVTRLTNPMSKMSAFQTPACTPIMVKLATMPETSRFSSSVKLALSTMLTQEACTSTFADFQVRTREHRFKGWWVGLEVRKVQAGREELDMDAHVTIGNAHTHASATELVRPFTEEAPLLRQASSMMVCNRSCCPRFLPDSFVLDILHPNEEVGGFRDLIRRAWFLLARRRTSSTTSTCP